MVLQERSVTDQVFRIAGIPVDHVPEYRLSLFAPASRIEEMSQRVRTLGSQRPRRCVCVDRLDRKRRV